MLPLAVRALFEQPKKGPGSSYQGVTLKSLVWAAMELPIDQTVVFLLKKFMYFSDTTFIASSVSQGPEGRACYWLESERLVCCDFLTGRSLR